MPSSVIHGMLYSPERQTLDIVFRDDRGTYRYYNVTPDEWRAFKRAPSKGTYLNATFKSHHPRYERFSGVPNQFVGTLVASNLAATPLRAARDLPDPNIWGFFEQP